MKKNILFVLSLALLVQCSPKNSADQATTLRSRLPQDPPTLDWSLATDNVSKEVIGNIQEGLVEHDQNNKVIPALAEKWTVSADGKKYTFQLRSEARWSDNTPVTAQQFVDSWERLLNPKTASEYAYFLFHIQGAEDYQNGKIKDFSKVGVRAVQEKTLEVTLKTPIAYWIHIPTFWVTFPIRKDLLEKHGKDKWLDPSNFVGTGAYVLKSWEHDSRIVLEKNPNYWASADKQPAIAKVEFRIIKESTTAVSVYKSGGLDIVRDLPPSQIQSLSTDLGFKKNPQLRGFYFGFNIKNPAVSNLKVRQAIGHAIDRTEVSKAAGAASSPTQVWLHPGLAGFDAGRGLGYLPEKAKALWTELGSQAPKEIELWFNQDELAKLVAENVQNQLKRNLGLTVKLQSQEWKVYLKTLATKAPAFWRMGWGADYPDSDTFMNLFTCKSGNNHTGFCDAQYDLLIDKAAAGLKQSQRATDYAAAEKILLEDAAAIVPLLTISNIHLVHPRIKGFQPNSMADYQIRDLKIQ